MSIWRQLSRGLRGLTNRRVADRDIGDEVESYLQQAAEALEANGASPEEARRAVRLRLGNAMTVREQVRSYGWERHLGACLRCALCRSLSAPQSGFHHGVRAYPGHWHRGE